MNLIMDDSCNKQLARQPKSFGTHDGIFHADEVSACALLWLFDLIDLHKVIRSREEDKLATCEFVCDVGGLYDPEEKRFDHHQQQYTGDKSSAGLVLGYLKEKGYINSYEWTFLNDSIITGVDAHDNGRSNPEKGVCTFSHLISNFAPVAYDASPSDLDEAFFQAVRFSKGHLERLLERYRYNLSCREKVAQVMQEQAKVLVFQHSLPWLDNFFALDGVHHPAQFVIMPSGNSWKLRGIPPNLSERMKVRTPMPELWAGLMDEALFRVCGIEGAIFCHKGRFISVWKTKEDALKAAEKALSV
jgi:uncharacterized UPF0160 family protein